MENKLNLESKDMISNNVKLISQLFPHCITEQDGKKVIDFNKLKEEFTDELVDETKEKYELNWPGKRAAINEARIKTNKTLLPLEEKSVDFEDTNNVYIEGDNLEVLKLLQESYLNKIKCIYIDPPYNTGKDFIYKDDFKQSVEDELFDSGQIDEEGNKFVQNTETNGRYHSDWLSMMYPRLKLARNLLREDGVIFISIDENEYDNLKKVCDEIFGEFNNAGTMIRRTLNSGKHDSKDIPQFHEYLLVYCKNTKNVVLKGKLKSSDESKKLYKLEDRYVNERGRFYITQLNKNSIQYSDSLNYPIELENGEKVWPGNGINDKEWCWRWSKEKYKWGVDNDMIVIKKQSYGYKVYTKSYEFLDNSGNKIERTNPYNSLEFITKDYSNFKATPEVSKLFDGKKIFDFPKPSDFIFELWNLSNVNSGDIVLDFFSGSSSSANALLNFNGKHAKKAKYIMVQLAETIDEKNSKSAYDFCIENDLEPIIPSIAQERIKRAGAKIKEETGADIDYGFRVFKLSDSILKANEVLPSDLQQDLLSESDSKYVDGVSKLDIVTSVILDLGLMLDSKIENIGNDNFIVEEDLLFISLSEEYDNSVLDSIRDIMPDQVVLDEKTFAGNDALMTNVIQQINEINSDITINIL